LSRSVKITAILSIAGLEALNLLYFGVDGVILTLAIATISGLAGYEIGIKFKPKKRKKRKKSVSVPQDL